MDGGPVQLTEEEYEHIEETIAQTAKGRAFLRRYARWAQGGTADDLRRLRDQMRTVLGNYHEHAHAAQQVAVLRQELLEMAESIEQARREISAIRPPDRGSDRFLAATNELDAIVTSTERASFDILNSAERLLDMAGRLRKSGADDSLCSGIENEVTNIFTACSFQDLTGQRTSKVVNVLRYIEQRINAMIQIWGLEGIHPPEDSEPVDSRPDAHLLTGPALPGQGISQGDVDAFFGFAGEQPVPASEPDPAPASKPAAKAKVSRKSIKAEKEAKTAPAEAASPASGPEEDGNVAALNQSAIDALFG